MGPSDKGKKPVAFTIGQRVGVPCQIQPGPFPGERLVTIETNDGVISGFVRDQEVRVTTGNNGTVFGTVLEVSNEYVSVRIAGSFFTTASGFTRVSSDWAQSHLQEAV